MKCFLFLKQHVSLFIASFFAIIFWIVLVVEKDFTFQNGIGALVLSSVLFASIFCSWKKIKNYSKENTTAYLVYSFILLFNVCWLIACFRSPKVAWDTWQMYDMSRYVFTDFGYMDCVRQSILNTHYEIAFPPIFPVLMALVNLVFDCGASAATFICGICALWIICLATFIGKKLSKIGVLSLCSLVFLCGSCFLELVKAGISQIFNFLILFAIVGLILSFKTNAKYVISLATLSSIGLMCRFDFLAVVVICFFCVIIDNCDKKNLVKSLKYSLYYIMTSLIVCSPWIIYSVRRFNKLFVTDNGRRLVNIVETNPTTFFSENNPAQTMFDNFPLWIQAFAHRSLVSFKALIKCILNHSLLVETLLCVFIMLLILKFLNKNEKVSIKPFQKNSRVYLILLVFIGLEFLYIFTGYGDLRYHLPMAYLLCFIALSFFVRLLSSFCYVNPFCCANKSMMKRIFCIAFVLYALPKCVASENMETFINAMLSEHSSYIKEMSLTEYEKLLKKYVGHDLKTICFFKENRDESFDFLRFSTLSHFSYILSPTNISYDNVKNFTKKFDINYLYSSNTEITNVYKSKLNVYETEIPFLYKIDP